MTKMRLVLSVAVIAVVFAQATVIHAQQAQLPHEKLGCRDSGVGKYLVCLNSTNLDFKRKPVQDFSDYEKARDFANELNKPLPLSSPYYYTVDERPEGATSPKDPTPPPSGPNKISDAPKRPAPKGKIEITGYPKFVDVPPYNPPTKKEKASSTEPAIVGKWTCKRGETVFNYDFKADGTYYLQVKSPYFGQSKSGKWEKNGDKFAVRQEDSGKPGTGGFSPGREIEVKIISQDRMMIDGDDATRK